MSKAVSFPKAKGEWTIQVYIYTDNQQYVEYTYNGLRFSLTKETHSGTWYYMGGPWRLYVDKMNIPQIGSTYTHFIIIIF